VHGEELVLLNLATRDYAERIERLQRDAAARHPVGTPRGRA